MNGISFIMLQATSGNILPPNFWQQNWWILVLGAIAAGSIWLNWAVQNKKLPNWAIGKFIKEDVASKELPEPLGIPYGFEYKNYIYDMINAETLKEGSTYGSTVWRIYYYDKLGGEAFKDCSEDRIEVPVNDSVLSGDEIIIKYIDDENMDKKDSRINILKDQVEEYKASNLALKEQLEEMRYSGSYKKSRSKQRSGAIHSSRTFGGSGTRYPHGGDDFGSGSDDLGDDYDED